MNNIEAIEYLIRHPSEVVIRKLKCGLAVDAYTAVNFELMNGLFSDNLYDIGWAPLTFNSYLLRGDGDNFETLKDYREKTLRKKAVQEAPTLYDGLLYLKDKKYKLVEVV